MAKKATKASVTPAPSEVDWPESIDLQERLPNGHERAGQLRYAKTYNGVGRMDMSRFRDVPQHLVDAALAAEAAAIAEQSKAA